MNRPLPLIVPVGGFLGSGKTTLLLTAARLLQKRELRSALVMNDQGRDLVDTLWAEGQHMQTGEVTGGCFCCRFSEFLDVAERLEDVDVIFAEPVGSCTDLAATILQPLQREFVNRFRVAPLTVLVDPGSVETIRQDPNTAFLFDHQLAEANLVCFSRSDLHATFPDLTGIAVRRLSGKTGEGVEAWLEEILFGNLPSGNRILEIDYQRYAEAEAALGWLNCRFDLQLSEGLSPATVVGPLLDSLDAKLTAGAIKIAHLKILDRSSAGILKAAITANGQEPVVEGDLSASPALHHEVFVNLRALADPETMTEIVHSVIPNGSIIQNFQAFRPAPPQPERRLSS